MERHSLLNIFSHLSIRWKMILLSAVGMLGMGAVAFQHFSMVARVAVVQAVQSRAAAASVHSLELANAMLEARRAEKDFLIRNDDADAAKNTQAVAAARQLLKLISDDFVATESDTAESSKPEIAALEANVARYQAAFQTVVDLQHKLGLNETLGLLGALRKSVHDAEERVVPLNQPELLVKMLMLRRHEKDFLARVDDSYRVAFEKMFGEFSATLAQLDLDPQVKDAIAKRMEAYRRDFLDLVTTRLESNAQRADLSKISNAPIPYSAS